MARMDKGVASMRLIGLSCLAIMGQEFFASPFTFCRVMYYGRIQLRGQRH